MSETHKQVIVMRTDLSMRKGKMVAQGAHASLKVLLDAAWPAEAITLRGNSPRIEEKGVPSPAGATISGQYLCIPNGLDIRPWLEGKFTKICVGIDGEEALLEIHRQAKAAGLMTALIRDAGTTEFGGVPTYTCVAVGPGPNEKIDLITGKLKLL